MYETLTGVSPFVGDNPVMTILRHISDSPKAFSLASPQLDFPDGLETVVMRCLAKLPNERYQSMESVRVDLERCRDGQFPLPLIIVPLSQALERGAYWRRLAALVVDGLIVGLFCCGLRIAMRIVAGRVMDPVGQTTHDFTSGKVLQYFYDGIAFGVMDCITVFLSPLLGVVSLLNFFARKQEYGLIALLFSTFGFATFLFNWLYHAVLESSGLQATIGKGLFSLRVCDYRGRRLSFSHATARHFAKVISLGGITDFLRGLAKWISPVGLQGKSIFDFLFSKPIHDVVAHCHVSQRLAHAGELSGRSELFRTSLRILRQIWKRKVQAVSISLLALAIALLINSSLRVTFGANLSAMPMDALMAWILFWGVLLFSWALYLSEVSSRIKNRNSIRNADGWLFLSCLSGVITAFVFIILIIWRIVSPDSYALIETKTLAVGAISVAAITSLSFVLYRIRIQRMIVKGGGDRQGFGEESNF